MAVTYEPIATTTLSSATGVVSFTSISSAYTDIVAVINATSPGNFGLWWRVNNDSGSNYSYVEMLSNGTVESSARDFNITRGLAANNVTTTISTNLMYFMNYSNTTTFKTAIGRGSTASDTVNEIISMWRSTSAINRIDFAAGGSFPSGDFSIGSTFTLYGIKVA